MRAHESHVEYNANCMALQVAQVVENGAWEYTQRCWQAWLHAPHPTLQALLDTVTSGQSLYLYLCV